MIIHSTVNQREMRITTKGIIADCLDMATGHESQVITGPWGNAARVLADSHVRDAVRSAYYNATSLESGHYPVGGDKLPEDFEIKEDA